MKKTLNGLLPRGKSFLYKKTTLKNILSRILMFPGFAVGFFGGTLFRNVHHIPIWVCVIVMVLSALWFLWGISYTKYRYE